MNSLEQIKESLQSNPNVSNEIKSKLFGLVKIFHSKLPDVDLTKLNDKLKIENYAS